MKQMARPKVKSRSLVLRMLVLLSLPIVQASATSIPHGTVDFVAEDQWITPGHKSYFGLHFQLEEGWHIYWVNPGDSGQPPRAEWHFPKGFTAGEIEWPAPRRLGTSTIIDFGYDDAVTLLVPIRAAAFLQPNRPAQLSAELTVLVCREICIPGKAHMSLSIPIKSISPEQDAQTRELFAAARKSMPLKAPADLKVRVNDRSDSLILAVILGRRATQATFFPLEESQIDNSAPQKFQPSTTNFRLTLRKSDQLLKPIARLRGVLEVSANESYVIDVPVGNSMAVKKVQ
jgi:thiol:disulfide interchange protein DsbD